ncbi:MAG: hypothetical protein IJW44_02185, partial [Clostridia bacterium]|nr:hypothetical protein [Clostridia bacterium]
ISSLFAKKQSRQKENTDRAYLHCLQKNKAGKKKTLTGHIFIVCANPVGAGLDPPIPPFDRLFRIFFYKFVKKP